MLMKPDRRHFTALLCAAALLAGCAATPPAPEPAAPAARAALAPTGTLRVAVYAGSPTSMVRGPGSDEMRGLSVEVGRALAQRLGVPAQIVVFERVAQVVDALVQGQADVTITNATPARAALVDFSAPLVGLELGYLVLPGSPVTSLAAVDQPGARVGVSQGSTSQATLGAVFKHAQLVAAPSLQAATQMLQARAIDTFATNKGILFEMADRLPGARVLDGRWGLEHLALAVPKGREAGAAFVRQFVGEVRANGLVQQAAERAGLRGTVSAP
jgi:polar amino acid transport system substrate-binding protein